MAGKDKLEFDVLANDKASTTLDKIASASKGVGKAVDTAADKGSQSLKKLSKSGELAKESLEKVGDGAKEGLSKLGEGLKAGPLAWIGIGAGLGDLVMEGFGQAMENEDANHLLTAQIGGSNADMQKLGKISGDLYKNAFGESVSDIDQVMKTVFQSGLASVRDGEDAIKGVTTQVMNYTKLTGEEALPVTRAISQMLKTGLARNATEAFDLLTRGVQKGLDKSEDLLDTVNEYGTQFRNLGLTGQQAFGLISQAIQGGARDSDIAADALKEFSIRGQEYSTTSIASYKALGLNAKQMSKDVAEGGPKAAAALQLVLDKLRGAKDRSDYATIAFGLFGTQSEDLGDALSNMNLGTATQEFGEVGGAAQRAGDLINDTTSNKLSTVGRTIKQSIVDAIGKYALPKLVEFGDWFAGPGKMQVVGWALDAGQGIIDFSDKALGSLQAIIPTLAKVGAAGLLAAAGMVALTNPSMALDFVKQAKGMDDWGESAETSIGKARTKLQEWSAAVGSAKTKVKLEADIEDLDQKIAKAQAELRDPGLTKERRAYLTAEIGRLTKAKDAALRQLNDPGLIKTRTAQLEANKQGLDTKLAAARKALADPKLTATKRANLEATIAQLLRQKANAQAAINALTGKTVIIDAAVRINAANVRAAVDRKLASLGVEARAGGGPVRKGRPYVVGEKRPELFIPEESGLIVPSLSAAVASGVYGNVHLPSRAPRQGGEFTAPRDFGGIDNVRATPGRAGRTTDNTQLIQLSDSDASRFVLQMLRKAAQGAGVQGDVALLITGKPGA